jgi:hypothetical protein
VIALAVERTLDGLVVTARDTVYAGSAAHYPVLARDRQMLAYQADRVDGSSGEATTVIERVDLASGATERLAEGRLPVVDPTGRDIYCIAGQEVQRISGWASDSPLVETVVDLPTGITNQGIQRSMAVGPHSLFGAFETYIFGEIVCLQLGW